MSVVFPEKTELFLTEMKAAALKNSGRLLSPDEIIHELVTTPSLTLKSKHREVSLLIAEANWLDSRKPFFNLYESVGSSLVNSRLAISPSQVPKSIIHELGTVCVKLPVSRRTDILPGVSHFFISFNEKAILDGKTIPEETISCVFSVGDSVFQAASHGDMNFEDSSYLNPDEYRSKEEHVLVRNVMRIALGVFFLANDPEFIKPVLLRKDSGRLDEDGKLAAKAKKRGVFGWTIGERTESSPHLRCPHFAVRWTGKGRTVPVLTPIRGSVIHRSKATEVPTGFEGE